MEKVYAAWAACGLCHREGLPLRNFIPTLPEAFNLFTGLDAQSVPGSHSPLWCPATPGQIFPSSPLDRARTLLSASPIQSVLHTFCSLNKRLLCTSYRPGTGLVLGYRG